MSCFHCLKATFTSILKILKSKRDKLYDTSHNETYEWNVRVERTSRTYTVGTQCTEASHARMKSSKMREIDKFFTQYYHLAPARISALKKLNFGQFGFREAEDNHFDNISVISRMRE